MKKLNSLRGNILCLLGATCWGLSGVAGKYVLSEQHVDTTYMITWRLLLAGVIFCFIAIFKKQNIFAVFHNKEEIIRILIISIFAFAICQVSYFGAIHYSNAGVATAMQQTAPIFVLIWILLSEKRPPKVYESIIVLIVVLGGFLLATGGHLDSLCMSREAIALAIISSITCAMYSVMPRPLTVKYGTFSVLGPGMLIAGLILVPFSKPWVPSGTWDASTFLAFALVLLIGTVLAFATFFKGISLIGSVKGSILGLFEPVVAIIASVLLLGQSFSATDIIGAALILLGIITLIVLGKERN